MCLPTYVPIFVFALSAATNIADGSDVLLLESRLIVQNGDAVILNHKCQSWNDPSLRWVSVVISILANTKKKDLKKKKKLKLKLQFKFTIKNENKKSSS